MFSQPNVRNSLILLGLSLVLWVPRLQGPIDLRYDAGVYYILGTSLAEGKGYRLLNEPGEIQALQYPPVLPAWVTLHQWLLGSSSPAVVGPWLRWSACVIFLCYIQAVYRMALAFLTPAAALVVGLITTVYLHSFFLSDLLFADIPFALASMVFLVVNRWKAWPWGFALTSLCGWTAFGLRTAGAALLVAWIAESVLHRHWKQFALRSAVAALPVLAWQAYISRVKSDPGYAHPAYAYQRALYMYYNTSYADNILMLVDPFVPERGRATAGDLAARVVDNLAVMPTSLGEGVTAGKAFWTWLLARTLPGPDWVAMLPITLIGCLVVAGGVLWLVRRQWLIPVYLLGSVGMMCLTPWPGQFTRYMTPLTPLLAVALLQALTAFREFASRHWPVNGPRTGLALASLVLALVLGTEAVTALYAFKYRHEHATAEHQLFFYDEKWAAFDASLARLRDHADPSAVLVTSAPHWAYLETSLRAVMPPMEADRDKANQLLESVPATYVLMDELTFLDIVSRYTAPAIQSHPDCWRLVFCVPNTRTCVYQRVETANLDGRERDGG